ncbi:MAG TPA: isoprenylcysteine carboxylmethyltransferase family protein, partial [Chloroflexota bacterium]|nr:isoprenylcysteine carboxylmethyltransferase family protein [Chloroflexota bacterium]
MSVNVAQLVAQIVGLALVFGLALFLAAGTIAWLAGWILLALFFGFVLAITLWLYRNNPGLLKERMRGPSADQKSWDKALLLVTGVLFLAWLVVMPLDAVRFGWSVLPVALQVVGAFVLVGSFYVFFVTFRENAFLS